MSGASESAAAMANRDIFGVSPTALQNPATTVNADASQPQMEHHMAISYNSDNGVPQVGPPPHYQPILAGATATYHQVNMNSGEQKRKRGRPKRYGPDGGMSVSTAPPQQQQQTFSPLPPAAEVPPRAEIPPSGLASPTVKKARGRPRGSQNKKRKSDFTEASGSAGIGLLPQIVNVNAGEDISSKILAVSQNGPSAVCVLSASGAISHVTLRQAATSGGTATYEGRFDILSLSGSFMLHEVGGQRSRTGGLSVALSGPDGRVLGGSVAGLLVAASPSQVVVGCFEPDGQKESGQNHTMQPMVNHGGAVGPNSSPSRGSPSESSGGPASPLNMSSGACIDLPDGMPWK
ncbi:AT hook motif DNA-binding family protein [Striga asiatica]|uniref:AT-hook motif nuclear-localized protein n=1 Tax=Striga asiatica TaxID=4170 RepID=A0A5A7QA60_STRAF|nr:AT hook motif DNA-binding family protein [Striga asiatica]